MADFEGGAPKPVLGAFVASTEAGEIHQSFIPRESPGRRRSDVDLLAHDGPSKLEFDDFFPSMRRLVPPKAGPHYQGSPSASKKKSLAA